MNLDDLLAQIREDNVHPEAKDNIEAAAILLLKRASNAIFTGYMKCPMSHLGEWSEITAVHQDINCFLDLYGRLNKEVIEQIGEEAGP